MVLKDFKSFYDRFVRGDDWHNLDVKRGNLGYGWVHYAFICATKPRKILCIGSKYGFIPAVCAMACDDAGVGMVDFVDASYDAKQDGPEAWGGAGNWEGVEVEKYFAPYGKKIKLYVMTTEQFCQRNLSNRYDYIYIDGDHSYAGVKSDFLRLWPRLNGQGYLVLHDIFSRFEGELYGTGKFWKKINRFLGGIEFMGEYGLGLVQKKDNWFFRFRYWCISNFL